MKEYRALLGVLALLVCSSKADAFCQLPQPRLACAEATYSTAVVIAQLDGVQEVESGGLVEERFYKLTTTRLLRGKVSPVFMIDEPNDSGRAPFDWKVGGKYLLFLLPSPKNHDWSVDGCGNSGPLSQSSHPFNIVESMSHSTRQPLISGSVSMASGGEAVPNAAITVVGATGSFQTKTGGDGRFQIRVPPGTYHVTAGPITAPFRPSSISYENPKYLKLGDGECAQMAFRAGK